METREPHQAKSALTELATITSAGSGRGASTRYQQEGVNSFPGFPPILPHCSRDSLNFPANENKMTRA